MTGYTWTISAGGTITAGGTAASNSVTVTWNTSGAQSVSVSYTNANSCTSAVPSAYNVIVNALPVPTISGPASTCINSIGNVYTTQAGMTGYNWVVSAGGTITSGGTTGSNTVTVTWGTSGAQTVSVSYTNSNGCTPSSPSVYNVTVNPLPLPVISGPSITCANSTGNVYSTQAGMSNYSWTVSAGGTVTAGGTSTSNSVTVTWNTSGAQTVSVSYTNANSCTSASPTVYNVDVNPLPTPVVSGPATACVNSTGNVYTTQAGMPGYSWTVSAGGSVTSGGTSGNNTVTITWNSSGSQTVSVSYTNGNGCSSPSPATYNVTVNTLPVPTVSGPASACMNSTANVYTTQAGMTGYTWIVSAGGTITSGGTSNNNTVTVSWNTSGAQSVSVVYTNGNGCTSATPSVYNVTVNPLPTPTISGPAAACINSTGNVYTTQAGMSNYSWTVSAGGTITSGGTSGSNTVTVTWNTNGAQTVGVSYTNVNGCTSAAPSIYNVTVNALPVPVISGPAAACVNLAGNVYTTQTGMTNYSWSISAGGTITAGTGTSSITVNWNTPGAQTVSVWYTNGNGCAAAVPSTYNVTVNPLPVPVISGPAAACVNSTGNVYTTQSGMTGYTWTISAGGTITAGAGTSSITVSWNGSGNQSLTVNYNNAAGCMAAAPATYTVVVNPVDVPVITGPASTCSGSTGNVYSTQTGMSNYSWAISSGGSIQSGSGTNSVTVSWSSGGAQSVSVIFASPTGCSVVTPTTYNVTVNTLPTPTVTGSNVVCQSGAPESYSTQPGMNNYLWTVSAGGTINSGNGTNQVQVTWNQSGPQWIGVTYVSSTGCSPLAPGQQTVNVNPLPDTPGSITGSSTICAGSAGIAFSIAPVANATSYTWQLPAGASIVSGSGTNSILVNFASNASSGVVLVSGSNSCGTGNPSQPLFITLTPQPDNAGIISGPSSICQGTNGVIFSVGPIANSTSLIWNLPAGATISSGAGTNQVTVNFSNSAVSGLVSVYGINSCGSGMASPVFIVTVNPIPTTPVITNSGDTLLSSNYVLGNQWYFNGQVIPGATGQTLVPIENGVYTVIVTLTGCSSAVSNAITLVYLSVTKPFAEEFTVYPVPNHGEFNVIVKNAEHLNVTLLVYNSTGELVYEKPDIELNSTTVEHVDIQPVPEGVYLIVLRNQQRSMTKKVLVVR